MREIVCAALLCLGCAHAESLRLTRVEAPALDDDLPLDPLIGALDAQAELLERSPHATDLHVGDRVIARAAYARALREAAALGRKSHDTHAFLDGLRRRFDFYRIETELLVTSYYEPIIDGTHAPDDRRAQPLYRAPPELPSDRPWLTRAEIDGARALANRGLELAWVDPIDAFILQTEGSGAVRFPDGQVLALAYAASNGQPHVRLGKLLPVEARASMQTMAAYLRALPEAERRKILDTNPRYIFFRPRPGGSAPPTSLRMPALDGRTVAIDPRVHPIGALGFLETEQPTAYAPDGATATAWKPLRRLVLAQDTGSGIQGARLDLYWGAGSNAGRAAGVMKQRGRLWILVPR